MSALKFPRGRLIILAKAPIPGQVKTRLTPHLSPEQAAQVHKTLLTQSLIRATQAQLSPVQLYCSPTDSHPYFQALRSRFAITLHTQQGVDLGQRMHHALNATLQQSDYAVLTGCDCPSLTSTDLEAGFRSLRAGHDAVLAPAEDGGYTLIGLCKPQSALFNNMPWGSAQVLDRTRRRIQALQLKCYELQEQWDVDRPQDLYRWKQMLTDPIRHPETLK